MPSVTRKSQSSRSRRRDEARAKLLEVVEQLLEEGEGFTEISVERLVAAAGMSRSTFYVYFEDKGDLLRAWFGEIIAELTTAIDGWWQLGPESTKQDLRKILDTVVQTYRPHTTLMAATYDAAAYDANVRELVETMMDGNLAALVKHIKAGQKAGFIDESLLPTETAAWLVWMEERGLHQLVRGAEGPHLERLIDAYTDIFWNTLYAPTRR